MLKNVLWFTVSTLGIVTHLHGESVTFTRDDRSFEIEFVTVGNPGNPPDEPDHTGLAMGAVDYAFQIAKFELSKQAFSVATGDIPFPADEAALPGGTDWTDAARLVNWLNTSTGHPTAYKFEEPGDGRVINRLWSPTDPGYDADNPIRNSLARYVLPTADEWHKAAYYDPLLGIYYDYANGSNDPPIGVTVPTTNQDEAIYSFIGEAVVDVRRAGGLSPYGTMGQTGNANEWEEGFFMPTFHAKRTGGQAGIANLNAAHSRQGPALGGGIRIVRLVPEPSSYVLWLAALLILLGLRRSD